MNGNGMIAKSRNRNDLLPRFRKTRKLAVLAAVVGLASATWAWEDKEAAPPAGPQGLSGIWPAEVPESLGKDAFGELGPNWTAWGEGATAAIAELYQSASGDLDAQRKAIDAAKSKLKVIDTAIKDRRYAKIATPLAGLSGALSRRIDLADAILATLSVDATAEYPKRLKAKSDAVTAAVDKLRMTMDKIPGGKAWLPFVKADELVKALSYEGGVGEGAVSAAKTTREKLASRKTIENASQKAFLNRAEFVALETAVNQYLTAAENPPAADQPAKLREQLGALVAALDAYDAQGLTADAAKARQAYAEIRKLAGDGGDKLTAVLQAHYFNYNVRVVASEEFLGRLLYDSHTEQGQVSDYILEAAVSGWQTTNTSVQVDLKPAMTEARWDLILNGNINSNTTGVTNQATVYTAGNHTFRAAKEVRFDGSKFMTSPGTISVNPNNTTTGIATQFSGGLFGGIADSIAAREVEARRGQAQAIAASRIQDRVLPRFNQEVDDAFVKAEKDLQTDLFDHLRETGLYPDTMLFQTTDNELRGSTRLMKETELGANAAPTQFATRAGATLFMHESEMNNAADRIGVAGKTMTDDEFRTHLEQFFSKAFNRKFTIEKPPEPTPAEGEEAEEKPPGIFVFAPSDPIRITLDNGTLSLTLRTGFKKENGEEIPQQVITVPLSFEVKGDKIKVSRGTVKVAAAEGGGAGQIATAGVIRRKIQNSIPEREVEAKFTLKGTRRDIPARVTSIRIVDGWAVTNIQ